ncbi:MAG: radical SAM protein [Deltaproteobacteria bacterium]|nr:radical SAM protein [Deltaproteobacteria bacterium]
MNKIQTVEKLVLLHSSRNDEQLRIERRERWHDLRPQSATLVIENRCHLKCDHCYEDDDSHPRKYDALSPQEYDGLFAQLQEMGVLKLTVTGGEVFLRKDLFEILEYAAKRRFYIELYTSGTLVDEVKAAQLKEFVHEVHISIYGANAEMHDGFTKGKGSFEKSVNALRLCKEQGLHTVMKSNIMTFNVDSLDDMMDLAESLGARFSFDPSIRARMSGDEYPLSYQVSKVDLATKVYNHPRLVAHFRQNSAESLCDGHSLHDEKNVICSAAVNGLSVGAAGEVAGCNFFSSNIGSVREQSLLDLWLESEDFDRIRKARFTTLSKCNGCDVRAGCQPCMAQAEIDEGDMMGCNTASRALAEGFMDMAQRRVKANKKLVVKKRSQGLLQIVGDKTFVPIEPGGTLSFD